MESLIIWIITAIIVMVILVPYFIQFRRKLNRDKALKAEAQELGADQPIAQFPQINQLECIGCGSCVDACPEGGVLGIVMGKATIINGLKCVGHGMCAEACPVGAIVIGLGDISKRDDIPFTDEHFQTNIPGLYVVGELGGLALIRNAIKQGNVAVEHIAKTLKKQDEDDQLLDVLIVGAGPAGLSAGLTAVKYNLNYLVVDRQGAGGTILHYPRKKLVMTRPVEIPLYGVLDKPEYTKEELLEIWEDAQKKFNLKIKSGLKLENVVQENGHFKVITNLESFKARTVVLALGRRGTPRKLNVPGEEQGKVMYRLLDAEAYQNDKILIVGGGDSAIEAAIGLAHQKGNIITISYRKDKFFRIKKRNAERIEKLIEENKVFVIYKSTVKEIKEKSVILNTERGEVEIENDYVFIFAGGEPPFALLKKIGIQFGVEVAQNALAG
ncbi:NAD(P)-binding domain-containing protein [Caldithrix abyssi]|uniref:FAD-dependent pyridine nucleotide-disulfide oxidoreductase n=1 Tax=Caldithrix abyssi DSM 13497 TaxID=880073 RepID=H1XVN4_CALAY|nr:NAD(P)-binding domain-containing protein [Caldithrix abyssi]APF18981.1 putative bacillithiol system oxidoreductase, YpdA family [Caldithrix abyssi DSM 13497]EHO42934.1 FAD-dependent pyridine nucleotide-disulfide oxidoreductase [Caldithrix abyssi DSM 13497]